MLWIDGCSSDGELRRHKRSINQSINPLFPLHQLRVKQRTRRRQHHRSTHRSVDHVNQSINQSTTYNSNTLTTSSSSCSINQTLNQSRMNRSLSWVGSIASSTCLSSTSSTTRRLPRKLSLKQSINQPIYQLKHVRSVNCLQAHNSIIVIDSEDEMSKQSINPSTDGSCCQISDCLVCSALSINQSSTDCASPSNLHQVQYLSDPESRTFFDQSIQHIKPLLFVPSVQSLSSLDQSIDQSIDHPTNQTINQTTTSFPHVTIDIPQDECPPITLQTPTKQPNNSQCYQLTNQLMSPPHHVIEVANLLPVASPANMFAGMQFAASLSPITQSIAQSINQLSPRYQLVFDDPEQCGTMVRAGCFYLVLGLIVLIASLYFLPLMYVSSFIHVLGFLLPLTTIVLSLYACACADSMHQSTYHLKCWLVFGLFNLLAHLGFAYHCIIPSVLALSPSIDQSALRSSLSLGIIVLFCSAMIGLVLVQVSHWADNQANDQSSNQSINRPTKQLKRPSLKPIKHSASLADLRSLLIERTRLRKQRREYARANGIVKPKDEKYSFDSYPSSSTD